MAFDSGLLSSREVTWPKLEPANRIFPLITKRASRRQAIPNESKSVPAGQATHGNTRDIFAAGTAVLPEVPRVPKQSRASEVIPHGPESPHSPIHETMPHESLSPRPSAVSN